MDGPARNWSRAEVEALAAHARQWIEGDARAPMVYVQMTPAAALVLMTQEGMGSIDAIVGVPEGAPWPDMGYPLWATDASVPAIVPAGRPDPLDVTGG